MESNKWRLLTVNTIFQKSISNFVLDEQELKVFVDLAMISAGEDDMEIDKISCMHTSCLGFGPLIFGYKEHHGFHHLMRLCRLVWQAVDANPDIKGKLVSHLFNLIIDDPATKITVTATHEFCNQYI